MTTITLSLRSGLDSCMRVVSVLRRMNIPTNHLELSGDILSITLSEEVYPKAFAGLSKCADIQIF